MPLPSKPRSVFEYISQKDRDRLRNFVPPDRQSFDPTFVSTEPTPLQEQVTFSFTYPRIEPQIAKAALSGFKPFTSDPVKQSRYTAYLQSQSQAHENEQLQLKQIPGQDLEHFQKELEEYAQAAIVFKPLSGAMAGRFTTATVFDSAPQAVEGLHTPVQEAPKAAPASEPKTEEKELDAKTHAATTGMYGSLTREVVPWQPLKLLCKRFGVKEPEIQNLSETTPASNSATAKNWEPEAALAEAELVVTEASTSDKDVARGKVENGRRDLANIGMGEDETQGRDILTYERPGKDIFKAIFASDDEDSDDENGGSKDKDEEQDMPLSLLSQPQSVESIRAEPVHNVAAEVVDMSSFKPKFVPRAERESDQISSSKKRKKDKEKKKKGGKVLVSFEVEEDEIGASPLIKEGSRKKRKSKHVDNKDEESGMWVEKPVPEVVQTLIAAPAENQAKDDVVKGKEEGPARMRKRAVDFL
jgi:G patch domain-containing protein 1